MSVTDQINAAANATAQYQASQPKATGAAQQLTSNDFLNLMMKQLQAQDPLNPTDNSQFIAQQAQFTQVSTLQEMSKNQATNNSIMQTLTLVGKDVVLTDPADPKKTISGTVSGANFDASGAAIEVNGKSYPITLVQSVKEHSLTSNSSTTSTTGTTSTTSTTSTTGTTSST